MCPAQSFVCSGLQSINWYPLELYDYICDTGCRRDVCVGCMERKIIPGYFPESRSHCCASTDLSPRTADSCETMLQAERSSTQPSAFAYLEMSHDWYTIFPYLAFLGDFTSRDTSCLKTGHGSPQTGHDSPHPTICRILRSRGEQSTD